MAIFLAYMSVLYTYPKRLYYIVRCLNSYIPEVQTAIYLPKRLYIYLASRQVT